MDNKNIGKSKESKPQTIQTEDHRQSYHSGIYMRDDHCDWGSSGMNEYTNEYTEDK